ncbi:MAG: NAD(P)/FAD-dependent oxidoreductase, partial [Actinomycetes bacterium]
MNGPVVVIGAGLAGANVVATLREEGFDGPVHLVGAEAERPYERPPLSKAILWGEAEADSAYVHPADYYADHSITTHFADAAVAIHKNAQSVRLTSGHVLAYEHLVLATGAQPRLLKDQPALEGLRTLRTLSDSLALKASLRQGVKVVIVGGGWIGLEVAAAAQQAGCTVTVLTLDSVPLVTVLGERMGRHFAGLHRQHGVDLRTSTRVLGIEGDGGRVSGVRTDAGLVPADLVLVAVGVVPATELAQAAGLEVDNGIVVDDRLQTSDPAVLAAGDVANAAHATLGRLRVEHWDNAIRQGRLAARTVLGGDDRYDWQPYFFTDQYDLGMEYV